MAITFDDLRVYLGYELQDFDQDDELRAEQAIKNARSTVIAHIPPSKRTSMSQEEADLVDTITLKYSSRIFENPVSVMQKRHELIGSVSYSDSSEGAGGLLKSERRDLGRMFGGIQFQTISLANNIIQPLDDGFA